MNPASQLSAEWSAPVIAGAPPLGRAFHSTTAIGRGRLLLYGGLGEGTCRRRGLHTSDAPTARLLPRHCWSDRRIRCTPVAHPSHTRYGRSTAIRPDRRGGARPLRQHLVEPGNEWAVPLPERPCRPRSRPRATARWARRGAGAARGRRARRTWRRAPAISGLDRDRSRWRSRVELRHAVGPRARPGGECPDHPPIRPGAALF